MEILSQDRGTQQSCGKFRLILGRPPGQAGRAVGGPHFRKNGRSPLTASRSGKASAWDVQVWFGFHFEGIDCGLNTS